MKEKRFYVDYVTDLYRSAAIIYAKDIDECIIEFKKLYKYRIIRIQDLEFNLS